MNTLGSALAFLTAIPLGERPGAPSRSTLLAFPFAGLAIGAACALVAWGAVAVWSPLAAAALVVAFDLALTGGLHADAVADVADGIASRAEPERALEIMREPQVGALGAIAVGAMLLLRFAWVAVLAAAQQWALIAAVPVCGRAAMAFALSLSSTAARSSLAYALSRAASPAVGGAVVVLAALTCVAAGRLAAPGGGEGIALLALAVALAVAFACQRSWRRRFGTLTGDGAGAAGVAAELAALAILALTPGVTG